MVDEWTLVKFEEVLGFCFLRLLTEYLQMQRIKYPFWTCYAIKRLFAVLLIQFMIYKNGFYVVFSPSN
jgi:hypothetical protein